MLTISFAIVKVMTDTLVNLASKVFLPRIGATLSDAIVSSITLNCIWHMQCNTSNALHLHIKLLVKLFLQSIAKLIISRVG